MECCHWVLTFTLFECTLTEGIASITRETSTRRQMINNLTDCVLSACSRTRVFAFVINARKTWWTIWVQDTLRSTTLIGISEISVQTSASTSAILFSTNGVCSTRTRWAWICYFNWIILSYLGTISEGVSRISRKTIAHWSVANDFAFCVRSTSIRAWIFTFLIDTS